MLLQDILMHMEHLLTGICGTMGPYMFFFLSEKLLTIKNRDHSSQFNIVWKAKVMPTEFRNYEYVFNYDDH